MAETQNKTQIMTGFNNLDKLTGGFKAGELILIGGRPAMGTTSFALNIAQNVALRANIPVSVFSLELSKEELVQRLWCLEAGIDRQKVKNLTSKDVDNLKIACNSFADSPIYVNDTTDYLITDLLTKYKTTAQEKHVELIIIDGISAIQEKSDIISYTEQLRQLAKELNIPVLVVSKISRTVEERQNKRPTLDDLFPTAELQELYDTIMLLYRTEYYDLSNKNRRNLAEVILAKHSANINRTATLFFNAKTGSFKDIDTSNFLFDRISSFNKDSFTAQIGDYWYEIDTKGNVLYKVRGQSLRRISPNLLMIKVNNLEGLIDNDFNIISGFKYSGYSPLDSEFKFFKFNDDRKWGLIDREDNILIQPKYDRIIRVDKHLNYLEVWLNWKKLVIDRNDNVIDDLDVEEIRQQELQQEQELYKIPWHSQRIEQKMILVNDDNEILQVNMPDFDTIPERTVKGL